MTGEVVQVKTFEKTGQDPFGAPILTERVEAVGNVLVQPGASADVVESNRPSGVNVRYTLQFPKTFTGDLEGAKVNVRGIWLDVVGRPDRFADNLCPTDWNMTVEAGTVDG